MINKNSENSFSVTCFLSHAWAKGLHHLTIRIAEALRAKGINVWVDEEEILPGDNITDRLRNGVKHESDIFLFVLSPESLNSKKCMKELRIAAEAVKPMIPIITESCAIPNELKGLVYVDFKNPIYFNAAIDRLIKGINKTTQTLQLIRALNAKSPEHRIEAADLLSKINPPQGVAALSAQIKEEYDPDVKYWLAIFLGKISESQPKKKYIIDLLITLQEDGSARVRQGAEQALCSIEKRSKKNTI